MPSNEADLHPKLLFNDGYYVLEPALAKKFRDYPEVHLYALDFNT